MVDQPVVETQTANAEMTGTQDGCALQRQFSYDVRKILIDRLLIGILIGATALAGNFLLEQHKARSAFTNEINVVRAKKTGETWENIYQMASKYRSARKRLEEQIKAAKDRLKVMEDNLKSRSRELELEPLSPKLSGELQQGMLEFRSQVGAAQTEIQSMERALVLNIRDEGAVSLMRTSLQSAGQSRLQAAS